MNKPPGDPRRTYRWQKLMGILLKTRPPICYLCGRPIDTRLSGAHPMGPTGDHIHPISMGGDPYDPDNVALAHRRCNTSKGNKPKKTKQPARPDHTSRDW